jgi:hypothetical protein
VPHVRRYSGFIANDDNTLMYNTLSTNKFYMLAFFAVDLTDMANPKMVPNFGTFERVGLRMIPHQDHPAVRHQRATTTPWSPCSSSTT